MHRFNTIMTALIVIAMLALLVSVLGLRCYTVVDAVGDVALVQDGSGVMCFVSGAAGLEADDTVLVWRGKVVAVK